MRLTQEELQWGTKPGRPLKGELVGNFRGISLGGVRKIAYAQVKRTPEVFEHPFHKRGGRYPRLVVKSEDGRGNVDAGPPTTGGLTMGRVVDVTMTDGRKIVLPFYYVVTDEKGSSVWLASDARFPAVVQLEQRGRLGPHITVRGIEG